MTTSEYRDDASDGSSYPAIGELVVVLVLILPLASLAGVVVSDMWSWFVRPLAASIPSLSWAHAAGLWLLWRMMVARHGSEGARGPYGAMTDALAGAVLWVAVWGLSALLQGCMP